MDAVVETYLSNTFEKFRLLRKTERGEIWLAGAPNGAVVVLKRVFGDGLPYRLLESHPHRLWPKILYCAEEPGETVIVEEFVSGVSLYARLKAAEFFTEAEAFHALPGLCDGLSVLHGLGVVHRDIKPSNLLLAEDGTLRLIDFDAARMQKERQSEDTTLLGTKGYAPPEQFGYGQTDARSDIYALGVTMKKMLGPDYRGALLPVLDKCTELDPKRRYVSARELKRAVLMRRRWAKVKRVCPVLLAALVASALYFLLPTAETPQPSGEPPSAPAGDVAPPAPQGEAPSAPFAPETAEPMKPQPDVGEETSAPQEAASAPEPSQPPAARTPDEEAEAFLALFADEPEKLRKWRARKETDFGSIERQRLSPQDTDDAKRDALDTMRRIELGERTDAFLATLPKTMTADEKGRAINEFVFEQVKLLGIVDF